MSHGQAGKGDRPRPFDRKKWKEGYERAFGKPKPIKKGERNDPGT